MGEGGEEAGREGLGSIQPKNKTPSANSTRGVSLSSSKFNYCHNQTVSQGYLRSLPVLRLLSSFPTKEGKRWTRRESNPHLKAGQAYVLPITPRAPEQVTREGEACGVADFIF
jgi:hypothetical protein